MGPQEDFREECLNMQGWSSRERSELATWSSAEMSLNALKLRGSLNVSSTAVTVVSWDVVHGWGKFSWKSAVPCKGLNLGEIVMNTEGRRPNSLRGERMLVL